MNNMNFNSSEKKILLEWLYENQKNKKELSCYQINKYNTYSTYTSHTDISKCKYIYSDISTNKEEIFNVSSEELLEYVNKEEKEKSKIVPKIAKNNTPLKAAKKYIMGNIIILQFNVRIGYTYNKLMIPFNYQQYTLAIHTGDTWNEYQQDAKYSNINLNVNLNENISSEYRLFNTSFEDDKIIIILYKKFDSGSNKYLISTFNDYIEISKNYDVLDEFKKLDESANGLDEYILI